MSGNGVEVEAAEVEEDVGFEAIAGTVAAGLLYQQLDPAVHAFGEGVAEPVFQIGDDGVDPFLHRLGQALHRCQAGFHGFAVPPPEEVLSRLGVRARLEAPPQFLHSPGLGRFQRAFLELFKPVRMPRGLDAESLARMQAEMGRKLEELQAEARAALSRE